MKKECLDSIKEKIYYHIFSIHFNLYLNIIKKNLLIRFVAKYFQLWEK